MRTKALLVALCIGGWASAMAGSTQRDSTWQRRNCLAVGVSTTRHDLIRGAFQDERINYTSEFRSFRPFISFSERFIKRPYSIDLGMSYHLMYAVQYFDQIDTLYNPFRTNTYAYTDKYYYHLLGIRAFVDRYLSTRLFVSVGFSTGYVAKQVYSMDSSNRNGYEEYRTNDLLTLITYGPLVRASYELDKKWALSLCLAAIHLGQPERFSDGITAVNFSLSSSYIFP